MSTKKTVWLLPYRYAAPARLEAYLEQMEAEGYRAGRIRQTDSLRMVFEKGAPRKVRYVADLNPFPTAEYRKTYEAFGWELAGKMASMYIWRMPYEGARPEAFTDGVSLRRRSGVFLWVLGILMAVLGLALVALTMIFFGLNRTHTGDALTGYLLTAALLAVLLASLAAAFADVRKNRSM